jgi:UDP-N-acetylmuramate--alanine ligase
VGVKRHIYFSGIGGTAIGPLALIAQQAGYQVSGSDKQTSSYIEYLKNHGISDIHIGQDEAAIRAVHEARPIDWFVYTSALPLENPNAPELLFCRDQAIKTSKRDELLNEIITAQRLKLIAIAGTHGKTTTTAMVIWLFQQLGIPLSYSVGAKLSFGEMGQYTRTSEYFVYEADEFDRNFLSFEPYMSVITGVSWDHHEIFPTREDYQAAFREFIAQSQQTVVWREDYEYLNLETADHLKILDSSEPGIEALRLLGHYNRLDAWLAIQTVHALTNEPLTALTAHLNSFPGLQRRMERLKTNLYTDYAHTPDKIRGGMSVARELAAEGDQAVIVIYEPLTNRRQHYMLNEYQDCFEGASRVYWLPSYLAREDPNLAIIPPAELIAHLAEPSIAEPAVLGDSLRDTIANHLKQGDLVVGMAGGGGHSLDEWLRQTFSA